MGSVCVCVVCVCVCGVCIVICMWVLCVCVCVFVCVHTCVSMCECVCMRECVYVVHMSANVSNNGDWICENGPYSTINKLYSSTPMASATITRTSWKQMLLFLCVVTVVQSSTTVDNRDRELSV